MLGKLFKYEIKATARTFIPLYLVLIVFAGISRLFMMSENSLGKMLGIPAALSMVVYFALIVAIFALTFVVMIQRFYKSLLGDEGYLMFTLPVKPWMHIVTKLITSVIWVVSSGIVTLFSVFILAADKTFFDKLPEVWNELVSQLSQVFGNLTALIVTDGILLMLVGLISGILMIFTSIAIGHTFGRNKLLASFGSMLVLYMISQTINAIIFSVIFFMNPSWSQTNPADAIVEIMPIVLTCTVLFYTLYASAYFIVTNYILSKRLNLE